MKTLAGTVLEIGALLDLAVADFVRLTRLSTPYLLTLPINSGRGNPYSYTGTFTNNVPHPESPSLERQGGRAGNSIKSQAMLLSYVLRLLQSLLLPELAHSTRFRDQFHGQLTRYSPCEFSNLSSPFSEFNTASTNHGFPSESYRLFGSRILDYFSQKNEDPCWYCTRDWGTTRSRRSRLYQANLTLYSLLVDTPY